MDSLIEELYLLGLLNTKEERSSPVMKNMDIPKTIRSLLDLYHKTFEEKKKIEEICRNLRSEIITVQEEKHLLAAKFSEQKLMLSNIQQFKRKLEKDLNDVNLRFIESKKQVERQKLQWERWAQLQRAALRKSFHQISTLNDELRKKICTVSSQPQNQLMLQVGQIHASGKCSLKKGIDENSSSHIPSKEDLLKKAVQRWDSAHRTLIKESADIAMSLRSINRCIHQSVIYLKSYIQPALREELNLVESEEYLSTDEQMWISNEVDNIRQSCLNLSKAIDLLQKGNLQHSANIGIVNQYLHSLGSFEATLDRAEKDIFSSVT